MPKIPDADTITEQARQAMDETRTTVRRFTEAAGERSSELNLSEALRDGAYATVGATDALVRSLLSISERLRSTTSDEAGGTEEADRRGEAGGPAEAGSRDEDERRAEDANEGEDLRAQAQREFVRLVARGREMVEAIGDSGAAERARTEAQQAAGHVRAAGATLLDAAKQARSGEPTDDGADTGAQARSDVRLEDRSVTELREMAQQQGVPGRTGMNKAELIRALESRS